MSFFVRTKTDISRVEKKVSNDNILKGKRALANQVLLDADKYIPKKDGVLRATPPNEPAEGLGRINDFGCTESCSIRVLSPKILPLLRSLLGSIANTASFPPFSSTCKPNTSIEVLFPAPGTPLIPIRTEFPE